MNDLISHTQKIFSDIRGDFDSLWAFKNRQESVEFITPYSTMAGEFVSVFLTQRDDKYVISDGGRLHELASTQEVNLKTRLRIHYQDLCEKYAIKESLRLSDGHVFCYKNTHQLSMLSACIYDLARFQEMVANAVCLETMFGTDDSHEERYFATKVKHLLEEKTRLLSSDKHKYELYSDEQLKFWKFATGIRQIGTQSIWLGMTIHRSTLPVYERGVLSAAFGFSRAKKNLANCDLSMGAIVDILPNDIGQARKIAFFQSEMDNWKEEFGAELFTLEQIDKMESMRLLFPAA